jgi:hypothetical protein
MANLNSAPKSLSMLDFWAVMDDHGGLAKTCKFAAVIRPVGKYLLPYVTFTQDLIYLTEMAELPGRGFMNMDVRYYGPNQKLPFQTSYEDISFTFLCRTESEERAFFDDWMTIINPINSFDFNYRDDYVSDIDIYQFADVSGMDGKPEATYGMTLKNAYPILINPQPVMWNDDQIQRLVVSFTYTHWSRYGIDPVSRSSGPDGFSYNLVEGRITNR